MTSLRYEGEIRDTLPAMANCLAAVFTLNVVR